MKGSEFMDKNNTVFQRRSIRKYKEKKVEQEKVMLLLEAAMAAPSAVNKKPWEFIVIDEENLLSEIRQSMPYSKYKAPLAVIVCGNMEKTLVGEAKDMWIMDCSAAIENMLVLAPSIELGSLWMGVYPVKERVNKLRALFNIPESVVPMGVIYFGYPDEYKEARTQYDEKAVFYNQYDNDMKWKK